jgi:hypothetical protein
MTQPVGWLFACSKLGCEGRYQMSFLLEDWEFHQALHQVWACPSCGLLQVAKRQLPESRVLIALYADEEAAQGDR